MRVWVFLAGAAVEGRALLKLQHSSRECTKAVGKEKNGQNAYQDFLVVGSLPPASSNSSNSSSKASRAFPTGRLQERAVLTIKVVESGRTTMPMQRIRAHLRKEVGIRPRVGGWGLQEAGFKRLLPHQEAGGRR
jgi:hypothetical protein